MLRKTIGALTVAMIVAVGLAQAQTSATLVLRSGDRVQGDLVDMNSSAFTMRVSGQERKVPVNQVSVVEFSGGGSVSDADWNKVNSGNHLVWLRSGETVEGRLYDVAGDSPKKLLFKTGSGERELSSNEVSRIAMARPDGSAGTSGSTGAPEGEGVAVAGNQAWTPTGMTVRRGEVLNFNAAGEVRLSADPNDIAAPPGSKAGRRAPNAPLAESVAGALIGRVGNNGEPFPIGATEARITMPANGQLFLGINDDAVGDNSGGFRVKITRVSRGR